MTATVSTDRQGLGVLGKLLESRGFEVFFPGSDLRPALIACEPRLGLLAVDLVSGDRPEVARVALNRKIAGLRDDLPTIARTRMHRCLIGLDADPDAQLPEPVISLPEALAGSWLDCLLPHAITDDAIRDLRQALSPRVQVPVPVRHAPADAGSSSRAEHRLHLDLEQSRAARLSIKDALLVTGPPGSGKTLVLAARARWLASEHPDWRIQMLCFNRVLVPYVRSLVDDLPSVNVSTFGKFAHAAGYTVSLNDEDLARRQVTALTRIAEPVIDALLIDEAQDFMPAWIDLGFALTAPGRGGVTLAGDPQQALYRDTPLRQTLQRRSLELAELDIPYRSTRQILDVTSALDSTLSVSNADLAPDGEPVDLVWAHSVDEQAAAVAWDVRSLLDAGERTAADIAVLVTRKWDIGRVMHSLNSADVPCRAVYPNRADEMALSDPSVKILTVHSAKGYEFPVVFLVGLEHLEGPGASERGASDGRTGYVGFTRAQDQLVITYTRDNVYLDRIRALPPEALRPWVWPDDYPEGNDGTA